MAHGADARAAQHRARRRHLHRCARRFALLSHRALRADDAVRGPRHARRRMDRHGRPAQAALCERHDVLPVGAARAVRRRARQLRAVAHLRHALSRRWRLADRLRSRGPLSKMAPRDGRRRARNRHRNLFLSALSRSLRGNGRLLRRVRPLLRRLEHDPARGARAAHGGESRRRWRIGCKCECAGRTGVRRALVRRRGLGRPARAR